MKVLSVNVSLPQQVEWKGAMILTSIFKKPIAGRTKVRTLNLDGDAQADLNAHGGEHRAVFVYQRESYDYWRDYLKRDDLHFGQFGENLTVEGLPDAEVCIGDRYLIGTAIFEVTQPRVTCYKIGISVAVPEMPALLVGHHRSGFYFRVVQEGEIGPGDVITKVLDGPQKMSITVIDALLYSKNHPQEQLEKALRIPALSEGWKYSFREMVNAAATGSSSGNAGLTGSSRIPLWPGFRVFIFGECHNESADVKSFRLSPADRKPLPPFQPGQHIAVRVPAGPGGKAVIRMYSLCGQPDPGHYRIAVKREKDGVASNYLHDRVKTGDTIEVGAPRGSFVLADDGPPIILLSAGVGVTPVLAMLWSMTRSYSARPVWWIHSTQNKAHQSFASEVLAAGAQLPYFHSISIYSRAGEDDVKGKDYDLSGHLSEEMLRQLALPANAECYLCGPSGWLQASISFLKAIGLPEAAIHFESFGSQTVLPGGKIPHLPGANNGTGPMITFIRSQLSFRWQEGFDSLLEAAEACDVDVKWSCRVGVCHRCESNLLSGEVNYSPEPFDPAAQGNILLCCSKPVSDVQIDL